MSESIHEYVVEQLQATKGQWRRVAKESGVSRRTIEKIARREIADPGVSFIETLANYFRRPLKRGSRSSGSNVARPKRVQ